MEFDHDHLEQLYNIGIYYTENISIFFSVFISSLKKLIIQFNIAHQELAL
jgi:hypothetical protein